MVPKPNFNQSTIQNSNKSRFDAAHGKQTGIKFKFSFYPYTPAIINILIVLYQY